MKRAHLKVCLVNLFHFQTLRILVQFHYCLHLQHLLPLGLFHRFPQLKFHLLFHYLFEQSCLSFQSL